VVPVTDTAKQHPPSTSERTSTPERQGSAASTPDRTTSRPHRLPRSRAGGLWVMLVSFAVVLLLLLIFILQNGQRSDVYYLGAHGHLPLGVALLLAAVFGILLVAVPTVVRVVQLRLMAARHRGRIAAASPAAEPQEPAGS
jgi:lipopolysaccharide assembly protein A